ncbi:MAG TPA: HNH endonuclease, partial [Blastocatellia bacterium]
MNGRVLVLNSTYEPINVCTMRRAIVLILKGVARAEERHEAE